MEDIEGLLESSLYPVDRSGCESIALVATEVSGACLLWLIGTCCPVRYGESWEACRSLEVMVCQKVRNAEASLVIVNGFSVLQN